MDRILSCFSSPRRWWPDLWREPDGLKRTAAATAAAILLISAFPHWNFWPAAWFNLVPLLHAVGAGRAQERRLRPRQVFFLGWWFGFVSHVGTCAFLIHTMTAFGRMPWIAAAAVLAIFSAYQAILWGVLARLWVWLWPSQPGAVQLRDLMLLAGLIPTGQWLFWQLFPWHYANSQSRFIVAQQLAEFTGPYGVSWMLALSNMLIHSLVRLWRSADRVRPRNWAGAVALLAVALGWGRVRIGQIEARMASAPRVEIGLIQGNISRDIKWDDGSRELQMDIHYNLTQEALAEAAAAGKPLDLVIWPETAASFTFGHTTPLATRLTEATRRKVREWKTPLLFGSLAFVEEEPGRRSYRNRVYLLDPDGRSRQHYDKMKLLAFGEYPPLVPVEWLRKYIKHIGNFTPGETPALIETGPARIGTLICYEALFPNFHQRFTRWGANLLVTVTNDMWFGDTRGPWLHWALLQLRAIEARAPLVRSANTGVTGQIDATGRIVQEGPLFQPLHLNASVRLGTERTFYTRFGNVFVAGLTLWIGVAVWKRRARDRSVPVPPPEETQPDVD